MIRFFGERYSLWLPPFTPLLVAFSYSSFCFQQTNNIIEELKDCHLVVISSYVNYDLYIEGSISEHKRPTGIRFNLTTTQMAEWFRGYGGGSDHDRVVPKNIIKKKGIRSTQMRQLKLHKNVKQDFELHFHISLSLIIRDSSVPMNNNLRYSAFNVTNDECHFSFYKS